MRVEFTQVAPLGCANRSSKNRARIIAASDLGKEHGLRAKWDLLLNKSCAKTLFYQSPEYFEHITKLRGGCAFLAILETSDGEPIGIIPMRTSPVWLKFEVRKHRLARVSFSGVRILGGTLLAPQSWEVFELLFEKIARTFPDCDAIEVSGLPTTSLLWDFLINNPSLQQSFVTYAPNGPRNCHTTTVPDSFTEYLRAFGHKKQYNLRRQIRRLDAFGNGSLALQRIDRPSGIVCFQNAWSTLGGHASGKSGLSESELLDFAERGLLLSYVLSVNGKPCGLAVGTRFRETLVMHTFRYEKEIAHLSPGTVLQTLMMKDLVEHRLAQRIDYGFGEPRYRLTNDIDERVTVIALRRGMVNQSLIASHRSYVLLLNGAKRLVQTSRAVGMAAKTF
jgi:hypothetical protein